MYVDVTVYPNEARSVIAVQRAETVGSETAEKINGTFNIEAINEGRSARSGSISEGGSDRQAKVKKFVDDMEKEHGTKFVKDISELEITVRAQTPPMRTRGSAGALVPSGPVPPAAEPGAR